MNVRLPAHGSKGQPAGCSDIKNVSGEGRERQWFIPIKPKPQIEGRKEKKEKKKEKQISKKIKMNSQKYPEYSWGENCKRWSTITHPHNRRDWDEYTAGLPSRFTALWWMWEGWLLACCPCCLHQPGIFSCPTATPVQGWEGIPYTRHARKQPHSLSPLPRLAGEIRPYGSGHFSC